MICVLKAGLLAGVGVQLLFAGLALLDQAPLRRVVLAVLGVALATAGVLMPLW
jgi:hypothetical protein